MKSKLKMIVLLVLVVCLTCTPVYAATYISYNQIGFDHELDRVGPCGTGKNGYRLVKMVGMQGNTISYKNGAYNYDGYELKFIGTGNTQTAILTPRTKYYIPAPWSQVSNELRVGAYHMAEYGSEQFIHGKILRKVNRETFIKSVKGPTDSYVSVLYAKIKNGKITKMVMPVILAWCCGSA